MTEHQEQVRAINAGREAYQAVQRSPSYAYLRSAPVETVEKLFLVTEATPKQRGAFRMGWQAAADEERG